MAEARELLRNRAEEESGDDEGLYYTEKQQRVLKALVRYPTQNTNQIGREADVHPSYVTYIIKRLPPNMLRGENWEEDREIDWDWLRMKAGIADEETPAPEEEEEGESAEAEAEAEEEEEEKITAEEFESGFEPEEEEVETEAEEEEEPSVGMPEDRRIMTASPGEGPPALSEEEVQAVEEESEQAAAILRSFGLGGEDVEEAEGMTFTITKEIPMQITFTIPDNIISDDQIQTVVNAAQKMESNS